MKNKKLTVFDVISIVILAFNFVSVICFLLPAGRYYYMPEFVADVTIWLGYEYCTFGMGIFGIVGTLLNIVALVYKKIKGRKIWLNILFIVLFALTNPLCRFLFLALMSV